MSRHANSVLSGKLLFRGLLFFHELHYFGEDFPGGLVVKNPPANAGDAEDSGSISGSERSLREGNGNPLQYSCLENSTDRGVWQAAVHGVTKSQRQLSD